MQLYTILFTVLAKKGVKEYNELKNNSTRNSVSNFFKNRAKHFSRIYLIFFSDIFSYGVNVLVNLNYALK